jgi:hypothetical protein
MTQNQPLPKFVKKLSDDGVLFTVDGSGNITPTAQQSVCRGYTILTKPDPASNQTFSGQVCARQSNTCQCYTLVGLSSGHMVIGTEYTISMSVSVPSEYELYAMNSSGPIANATNGDIYVGG